MKCSNTLALALVTHQKYSNIACLSLSSDFVLQVKLFGRKFFQLITEKYLCLIFSSCGRKCASSFQTIAPMHRTQNYLSTWIDSNVCERQSEVSEFQACEGQMTAQKCLRFAMLTKQSESATSRGRLVTRGRAVPCSARRTTGSVWTGGDGFPCTGYGNPPTARVEMAPKRG